MDAQSITSYPLVTTAAAMDFCEAGAGKQAQIALLVAVATREIEQECGCAFGPQGDPAAPTPISEMLTSRQTLSHSYDWGGYGEVTMGGSGLVVTAKDQSFQLMGVNINPASVKVWYDPTRQFTDDTLFDPTQGDYFMDGDTLVVQRGTVYCQRGLKVSYNSGFAVVPAVQNGEAAHLDPTKVPPELQQACLLQTMFLKMRSKTDNVGMVGERSKTTRGTGNVIVPFSTLSGLTPEASRLVAPYKRVLMGYS